MNHLPHQKEAAKLEDAAKKKAELARKQEVKDLNDVLSTAGGRRVLLRIMEHGKPLSETYTPETNAYYNAGGKRAAALWLLTQILNVNPDAYRRMMAEKRRSS